MRNQFRPRTFPHIGAALSPVIPIVRCTRACNHGVLSLDVPQHTRETAMNKFKMMVLVASMCALPSAFAAADRVLGEKLDSGLGQLGASYTAWEYMPAGRLLGESLDSGLGKLGSDYTAWEFMPADALLGEGLGSRLGPLAREELEQDNPPARVR